MDTTFWIGLLEIIGINIVLSGDNAVVIALAARSLPQDLRRAAIVLGSLGAILMRVVLTVVATELLTLAWLRLIGGALLLWIGVKLLVPDSEDEAVGAKGKGVWGAVRTILVADLVMSLDNVLGVAAASHGSILLLLIGLGVSIPLIVLGSALILKIMDRFPIVITLGAALIGYVAGEMLVSDAVISDHIAPHLLNLVERTAAIAGAAMVVAIGLWIARREKTAEPVIDIDGNSRRR